MTKLEELRQERDKWGELARLETRILSETVRIANEAEKAYQEALKEQQPDQNKNSNRITNSL